MTLYVAVFDDNSARVLNSTELGTLYAGRDGLKLLGIDVPHFTIHELGPQVAEGGYRAT